MKFKKKKKNKKIKMEIVVVVVVVVVFQLLVLCFFICVIWQVCYERKRTGMSFHVPNSS